MNGKFAKWSLVQLLTIIMIVAAGTAFAAGEALVHNSNNLGPTYGNWGVVGGKYGEFTCTTCHNKTTSNVKRVAGTLTAPLGSWSSSKATTVNVVFNNMTAFGNDADGHTTSARICEVCHSQTTVHRYNTTGQVDIDHKGANQTDCTVCHSHADAFKGKGCTACHGSTAASSNPIITGKHAAHIANAVYGCADCHAKSVTDDATIKSVPSAHQNSTYGDFSGARAGGSYAAGNCSNVYCHTNGKGAAPATAVNWTTGPSLDCKGCHGGGTSQAGEPVYASGAAGSATANTHPKHVGTTNANATCQNCHGATVTGTVISAGGKHTDRAIDVVQGNGETFTYTEGSKTCSASSCHSNGFFTAADAQWGATMPADCSGCHAAAGLSSGNHNKHLTTTKIAGVSCATCHVDTAASNNALKSGTATHTNNALNVKFSNFSSVANFTDPNCSNLYCHSYGTTINGTFKVKTAPVWGGSAANCFSCHGSDSTTGLLNNMSTGRHKKHVAGSYSYNYGCAVCHASTVSNNTTISDSSKHVNVQIDVSFSGVAKTGGANSIYDTTGHAPGAAGAVNQSCSNVYCHSNAQTGGQVGTTYRFRNLTGVRRWNQSGTLSGCSVCHGNKSTAGAWVLSGAHVAHVSQATNLQIGKELVCNDCHANGGTNLLRARHANGLINYSSALGGSIASGNLTLSTGRCNTVYCHSNGRGAFNNMSTNNWFSGVNLGCNGCHGDTTSLTSLSGKHDAHVNKVATGGNFGCATCHASTASNNTTLTATGKHVNTFKDFSGSKVTKNSFIPASGTCANSCHTDGKGGAPAVAVTWTGAAIDCAGCHAQGAIATGGHQSHLTHVGISCANCHISTTNDSATITGTTHIDGTVNLQEGGTFNSQDVTFTPAGSGCNNISCHGGASAPDWTAQATCATCHPNLYSSGHHSVHMGALNLTDSAVLYNMTANRTPIQNDTVKTHGFGCANCHPLNIGNHLNGSIDVDMSSKGVTGTSSIRFLNSTTLTSLPQYSGGTCANIYCHSNASRVASELVYKPTPTWAGGSFTGDRCAACHDNQPATGAHAAHSVGNHTDNIYNGKSGKVTVSNRANTAHGNAANSTTIGCYICHNATVTSKANDQNLKCVGCHYAGNPVGALLKGAAAISNLRTHVNGAREIQFLPVKVVSKAQIRPESFKFYSGVWQRTSYKNMSTLSYDTAKVALDTATMWHPSTPMASNCTNIACHNGKTVAWNLANWSDPNKCMDCHNQL